MTERASEESSSSGFVLRFLRAAGRRIPGQRVPLASARRVRLERVRPVARFPSYAGQWSFPGRCWSSSMSDLAGSESGREGDGLVMFGFSPGAVAFPSRSLRLTWPEGAKGRNHVPGYFARMADRVLDRSQCPGKTPGAGNRPRLRGGALTPTLAGSPAQASGPGSVSGHSCRGSPALSPASACDPSLAVNSDLATSLETSRWRSATFCIKSTHCS